MLGVGLRQQACEKIGESIHGIGGIAVRIRHRVGQGEIGAKDIDTRVNQIKLLQTCLFPARLPWWAMCTE